MTRKVDPLSLPRVTPSKLGDQSRYQPRRRPDRNGMPDPRNAFRPTIDGPLLKVISLEAFKAHLATVAPQDWRALVTGMLLADVDRRFPVADMAICSKYAEHDVTRRYERLLVDVARYGSPEVFPLHGYGRDLPPRAEAHRFTVRLDEPGPIARVPEIAMPLFDAIASAYNRRADDFDAAVIWPQRFNHKQRRPPKWAEIEETFPCIGAWMASKRKRS